MVASVIRRIVKSRTPKGKRVDVRASSPKAKAAKERRERQLNKKRIETKVTKATKPPKGIPIPPKPEKMSKAFQTKSGAKKLLKKYGIPLGVISSILAGSTLNKNEKVANKSKATKTKTPGPGNKSNAPNPFNNINPPAKRKGPGGPRMTSMRAPSTGPKPRNKNVTRRPKRPSKQGSFGR
tara:strand:- start:9 stop:551 length:543 start_codon:yes stop_codon:yes gene_type:complete